MPRASLIRTAAVDYLSGERGWRTLQQIATAIGASSKSVRQALRAPVAESTVYYRIAAERACFCIGIVPMPRLDLASIPARSSGPPPRAWTLDYVRARCEEVGDCWLWKQGVQSKGYPQASINGKTGQSVRHFVYTELMGKKAPASRKVCITSRCGSPLCLSPLCLTVRRRADILRDQWTAGIRKPTHDQGFVNRKLTREQVDEIRAMPAGFNQSEVARRMGVHARTVCQVHLRETWKPAPASNVFEWRP